MKIARQPVPSGPGGQTPGASQPRRLTGGALVYIGGGVVGLIIIVLLLILIF